MIDMDQKPITVFAKWQIKHGKLSTVLNLLSEMVTKSKAEEGNLFYQVHQSNTDANTIMLFEGYKNETALAAHRGSEHFQSLVMKEIVPMLENREVVLATEVVF
jgi:autoinducer 2-degrading protein